MYKSPIDIFVDDVQKQFVHHHDKQIHQVVMNLGINVDKDELIRALQYDREQYDRGFADGYQKAKDELVLCMDCKSCYPGSDFVSKHCSLTGIPTDDDDYCSYGERKDNDNK